MIKPTPARSGFRWRRRYQANEEIVGYLFVLPWIIGFLAFKLGPMLVSLVLSFLKTDLLTGYQFIGFGNYSEMLGEGLWRKSLLVTSYYTFALVPLQLAFSLALAIMLNQKLRALALFRTIYYLPSIITGVSVAVLWIWLLSPDFGLVNGFLRSTFGIQGPNWLSSEQWAIPALVLMGLWGVGGNIVIFLAGLQGIPDYLYDAARIDGAGRLRCFRHVTLPMMTPTIFFNVVTNIIWSYQVFTQAFVMTAGGPNNATMSQVLYLYRKAFMEFRFGYASAIAWGLFVIILIFTLILLKSGQNWVYYEGEERT